MQVFLPYPNLQQSVSCLDPARLGNQIYREAKTLITGGWPNHPAAKIWANHRGALACYALYGLEELSHRGRYYPRWFDFFRQIFREENNVTLPSIIGHPEFHAAHRSQLLLKNPSWYSQFGWTEEPGALPYIWSIQ